MNCPQCKRPLRTRDADGRELRICDSCGYRTYGIRHAGGGGREAVLDRIADEVAQKGRSEIDVAFLLGPLSSNPWPALDDWSGQNELSYDVIHRREGRQETQHVLFRGLRRSAPMRPNHAMQRTAARPAPTFCVTKTSALRFTRALAAVADLESR